MENKTGKTALPAGRYFKYAIGEIILVVIGILIALQINNWNNEKNNDERIRTYALNLVDELKGDIKQTNLRIRQIKRKINYVDSTAAFVRNKTIEDITNIDAIYEFNLSYSYRPFNWFNSSFKEIQNSGSLKLIKNDSLRKNIIGYYSFTNHLDEDYKNDNEISNQLYSLQSRIINTNYPNREQFIDSLTSYYSKPKSDWLNSPTYQNAKQLNLSLLTDDINDIHELVNLLFKHKWYLSTRANGEFPRLIKNAEKIIEQIESEYKLKTRI